MALSAVDASQIAGKKRERAPKLAKYLRLTCAEEFRTTLEQEEVRSLSAEGREATQRELGTEDFQLGKLQGWCKSYVLIVIYIYMLICLHAYLFTCLPGLPLIKYGQNNELP
eukprot:GHVU01224397.1.p1 GENE.GHVU01224397.1~~GHVU01224397.1.p1  ORF type:complete len:112 (-),score=8.39 GHVU01224397.1:424-759(-)